MKPDMRWQLLLAVVGLGLVVVLFFLATAERSRVAEMASAVGLQAAVEPAPTCTVEQSHRGGILTEGIVGAPHYLNPLLSDANPVDQELVPLIFDGLTQYDDEGHLVPNLAQSWSVSEDGRTVTFTLRDDIQWHDGTLLTATDVAFTYRLMQEAALPDTRDKVLWESAEISQIDDRTIAITLPLPYSPFLAATTRGILPAHILGEVSAAELLTHPFNQTPIGTGPFRVEGNWQETGRLLLIPNERYWQSGFYLDALAFRFFAEEGQLLEALRTGEVVALNRVSAAAIPTALSLPQARLFTAPSPRYTQLLFNLTESGAPPLQSLAVRQGLAYALDREALIDRALNGQGLPLNGPYLPQSLAYNPNLPALTPHSLISATAVLDASGWVTTTESSVRQSDGKPFQVRLLAADAAPNKALAAAIAEQWGAIGVEVDIGLASPSEFAERLRGRDFDIALVEITPARDPDLYDFWSQEAIVRGQNYAGWNNRRASEALEAARQVWNPDERLAYYNAFLKYYAEDLPAITLFQEIYTYVLSADVGDADIGRIDSPRERYASLAQWYLNTQAVLSANCANLSK